MADQTATSLRVRVMADIADIKQGLAVVRGQVASIRSEGSKSTGTNVVNKLGDDAKSTSRELAMVMPQITDIVTSLQGGMPFTTVLLQQGGQLRDVFGGTVPALKAVGGALAGLVNPATLTAAAIAALGAAWYSAESEQQAFGKAIILQGERIGVTRAQLESYAQQLGELDGITVGSASEALAKVADTGKFAGDELREVAKAALEWERAGVQSADATIAAYVKIKDDPVAALKDLEQQTNVLTDAQRKQIESLIDQGKQSEASAILFAAFSRTIEEKTPKLIENAGLLSRAFGAVKDAFSGLFDGMKNLFRPEDMNKQLEAARQQLSYMKDAVKGGLYEQSDLDKAQARYNAALKLVQSNLTVQLIEPASATQKSKDAWDKLTQTWDKAAAARAKLAEIEKAGKAANKSDAEIKAAQDAWTASQQPKGTANASRKLGLQQFENAADVEKARVEAQTKVLQAQYQARGISASEYYAKLRALTVEGTDAQAGALEKEIAYLKARAGTGKDAIATTQKIGELEAKLATVRSEGAAKVAVLDEQEAALKKQREDAIRTYKEGLDQQTQALQSEMDAMVAHVGAGDREYEIRQRIAQIYAKQAGELKRLADARVQAGKDTEKLSAIDQQEADLRANTEQQVSALIDGYQRLATAQGEWSNGAKAAWANYLDDVRNVAGAVQDALTSAFKGGEDAFVQFVKTGKLSFSSLADSIIEDMARIAYRQAASGIGSWLSSLFGGYSAPSASFASGFGNNTGWLSSGQMGGYASGGYTGDGGKFDPAGIVHKGEGVVPQWGIAAMGGPAAFMGFLGTLRSGRGYADGGVAGIAAAARTGATAPKVEINIENNSNSQLSAQAGDVKFDGEKWVIKIVAADLASGGAVAAAGKGRFGWKDQL